MGATINKLVKNVPSSLNGDIVVGFTNTEGIKDLDHLSTRTLAAWYHDDTKQNHLGMVDLFSSMTRHAMPMYKDLFKTQSIIELNGFSGSKFTYDLPVEKESKTCQTAVDTSSLYECPGIEESLFEIVLTHPYKPGDILTYDGQYGEQLIVSGEYPVKQEGGHFRHTVTAWALDGALWYPADKLKAGINYYKVGHVLGEYETQFSSVNPVIADMGTIRCEFELHNHRGVETFITAYADSKMRVMGDEQSRMYQDHLMKRYHREAGKDSNGDYNDIFLMGLGKYTDAGRLAGLDTDSVRLGTTWEYLVISEYFKLEAYQNMFQKAGNVRTGKSHVQGNEGAWHQMRRGRIINYARVGGINKSHISEAVSYLFRNRRDMAIVDRKVKFKCGAMAFQNMLNLFRNEVYSQLTNMVFLLGDESKLGTPVIKPNSPNDLKNLKLEAVRFTEVYIPDIGTVEIEHDPCLDFAPITERFSQGFYGEGYAWSTYSMVIWDLTDKEYSNAFEDYGSNIVRSDSKTISVLNENSNSYYVKPKGPSIYWGTQLGRYSPSHYAKASRKSNGTDVIEVAATMKDMGYEYFIHGASAYWLKDISRYLVIELDRKGFSAL